MKRLTGFFIWLAVALIGICAPADAAAAALADETLHYVITYKWGLIHKEAGTAVLTLRGNGNDYRLRLTAQTRPWADRIFRVRDTLVSDVRRSDLRPHRYVRSAHEGGRYSRDELLFTHSGDNASASARRLRVDKKGGRRESEISLSATGPTFDMLSVFYFLRSIDYQALSRGKSVTANIFSGKQTEKLTIRCDGKERLKLRDGTNVQAWHIRFRFTSGGGKKSSDDIDAWISVDQRHIPLQLIGSLPVGQVRAYLVK